MKKLCLLIVALTLSMTAGARVMFVDMGTSTIEPYAHV